MKNFTLSEKQLVALFGEEQVQSAMGILESMEPEQDQPDTSSWQQLKREKIQSGILPEDRKKAIAENEKKYRNFKV